MSRCFPFPPPGYEKKLKVDDVTLLAKEKDKEKKEKKHKKDKSKEKKEKKEGRGKDKERSKEKHKEKDKHKDRDKKNDKKQSQNERRFEADRPAAEKVGSNSPQRPCVQEFEQRFGFVNGATGSKTVLGVPDRDRGKAEVLDEVASRTNGAYWNGGKGGLDQMATGQVDNQSISPKVEFIFSNEKHHNSNRKGDKSTPPSKEAAIVQDLQRRIRDETGATGSQGGSKTDVTIQKRAKNFGEVSNGNAICFSQTKVNCRIRNDSNRLENGQKDDIKSKVPRVAIVNNIKAEDRGSKLAGAVDMNKKSGKAGLERNGFCGKGGVDNKKNDQFMNVEQNKARKEQKLKEETENVNFCRYSENGGDSTDNSKNYIFKMSNKTAEVTTGKRKEPEANGILHDNETRPNKFHRTVLSSPVPENERNSRTGTTITLSTSKQPQINGLKLDGDDHKSNGTMGSQSPHVSTKSPSLRVKPMEIAKPMEIVKPSISAKANGKVGVDEPPFGPRRPPLSVGKFHGMTGSLETSSVSATAGKVNGSIAAHGSPLGQTTPPMSIGSFHRTVKPHGSVPITTKATATHVEKVHETAGLQETAKPALTAGKVNGVIGAHGSPPVTLKSQSTSRKEKHKDKSKSSSKPRPPHPDTEYLSQILSVPKVEELPEFDDLEWLVGSKNCTSMECEVGSSKDGGEQVWSKAVHIESADVYALPYVIPY